MISKTRYGGASVAYAPFPWQKLSRIPKSSLPILEAARELAALHGQNRPPLEVLQDLLRERVQGVLSPARIEPQFRVKSAQGAAVLLRDVDTGTLVLLEIEAELASRVCRAILGRPVPLVDRFRPAPDSVQGAVAALALATSRRCCGKARMDLVAVSEPARREFSQAAQRSVVVIDGQLAVGQDCHRFAVNLLAFPIPLRPTPRFALANLKKMGEVVVELPLIVARFWMPSFAVQAFDLGDVLMPSDGWMLHRNSEGFSGQLLLCAPGGAFAICADLHHDGQVVLGETLMKASAHEPLEPSMHDDGEPTIADVIAQAPLVVQIEIGSVSLTAAHWAELKPGDVIATGRPLGDRVAVRIAGREVAFGELVDLDGELGVRIKSFVSRERVTQ